MWTKQIVVMLLVTAAGMTIDSSKATAAVSVQVGTPNFSFSLSDYQPAPANVYIHSDRGRPYYIERDRRVYLEKKHHRHKKQKKHRRDTGNNHGHGKH